MKSFVDIQTSLARQPLRIGARLALIDTCRGREQLYRAQRPELLQTLAKQTRVESITASNAIEGVIVSQARGRRLIGGPTDGDRTFRNRTEREFAGYRDAVDELVRNERFAEPISVPSLLHLHRQLFRHLDPGGGQLKRDENLIVSYENGRRVVLFAPPDPAQTPFLLGELCQRYNLAVEAELAHPLLLIASFVLDLLAIHPFADGNGRVARLATTQLLLQHGYSIPRYVSIEQLVYQSRSAYYDALYASQRRWHEAQHDPWPWTEYLVGVLGDAYERFEQRVSGASAAPGGSKQQQVRWYVLEQAAHSFTIGDIREVLPHISDQTIRLVLADLKQEGLIQPSGSGRSATWSRATQ